MNNLLPVFMKLDNKRCVVIGGGRIAIQKIQQLLKCNAIITVIAPQIDNSIQLFPVKLIKREYQTGDLNKSKLVIAATNDDEVNQTIYKDSQKIGIPVNVVDQPHLCSFYMGSVYQDGDIKIAVSTNGKCPTFSSFLRDHIRNISKGSWGKALEDLASKRENIIRTLTTYLDKKETMKQLVKISSSNSMNSNKETGKVFLVGAGPGDPELITAKGLKAIQNAEVILHDALIHPHLVFGINPLAKKIYVGKRQEKHSVSQEAIHSIMIEEALKGRQVVRLKGGDPFIFGRGGEEARALAEEGLSFEVIPGVTAGVGAAAGFGIPLTHRKDATSILFITAHQCRIPEKQDWPTIAKLNSTLVFYMGARRLNEIVMGLVKYGKSKKTPIAIVQNATLKSQNIITSNLESILDEIKNYKRLTPAIIIIGEVVNNYKKIQKCIDTIPSEIVTPLENSGFDIWENQTINA